MHPSIAAKQDRLEVLCRRYGVARLAVFGSAARGADFDPDLSDADFLVEFRSDGGLRPLQQYFGLATALEELLGRPVDLIERGAIEAGRKTIRRRAIFTRQKRSMVEASCGRYSVRARNDKHGCAAGSRRDEQQADQPLFHA